MGPSPPTTWGLQALRREQKLIALPREMKAEAREGDESRINAGAEEGEVVVEDEGSKT